MKVMEIVCDQCEKETTNEEKRVWFFLKDPYDIQYHFCSWECLTIYGWLMAEWENQFKHSTPLTAPLPPRKNKKKVVPLRP